MIDIVSVLRTNQYTYYYMGVTLGVAAVKWTYGHLGPCYFRTCRDIRREITRSAIFFLYT